MPATVSGFVARKAAVNHRSMVAAATGFIPCVRTVPMRAFHISGAPIFAAVLQSTSLSTRCGVLRASHMPIIPPMDSPQKWKVSSFKVSAKARTSFASCSIEYGPGVTEDCPWPRVSQRRTRKDFRKSGICASHMEKFVPRELDKTRTGFPGWPSKAE